MAQFLDALNAQDAITATALLCQLPADATLLTDQVLRGSPATPPLFTDIHVDPQYLDQSSKGTSHIVQASYSVNGQTVDSAGVVTQWDGSSWKVCFGAVPVLLDHAPDFPVTVNGVSTDTPPSMLTLFPGVYTIDSGNPLVKLTGGAVTFTVTEPGPTAPSIGLSDFAMTDSGLAAVRAAVEAKLTSCMTMWASGQSIGGGDGCPYDPFKVPGQTDQTWRYATSATLDDVPLTLEAFVATWQADDGVPIAMTATIGGTAYTKTLEVTQVRVDLTDPDNLAVTID